MHLYRQIQDMQPVLRCGTLREQDAALSALHETLCDAPDVLYPSAWYPCLTDLLRYYCRAILPQLPLPDADRRFVAGRVQATIRHLDTCAERARRIETRLSALLGQLRQGLFPPLAALLGDVSALAAPGQNPSAPSSDLIDADRAFRKSGWTFQPALAFCDALCRHLPGRAGALLAPLLRDQLADWFQMKAILVKTLTGQGVLSRLDITTTCVSGGLDEVTFETTVDEALLSSCYAALQAARAYLDAHFPQPAGRPGIAVRGRFADPAAAYHDRSVSLLLGLKIVGDVVGLDVQPDTVVTGALDASGQVLPVDHLPEKIAALERHPEIRRLIYPAGSAWVSDTQAESSSRLKPADSQQQGTSALSTFRFGLPSPALAGGRPVRANGLRLEAVQSFEEAALAYYGEALRRKLRAVSRRQILRSAVALATIPVGLLTFKNIFSNPVSEHDWQLVACAKDLYQVKSDYRSALMILDALWHRFQQESSQTQVIRLQASILGQLGIIYLRQNRKSESLRVLQQSFELWRSIRQMERQVDTLLHLGDIYRYMVVTDGNPARGMIGLRYYRQAQALLHSGMLNFSQLRGKCCGLFGYMYYWLGEYERARQYGQECVQIGRDQEGGWAYQTAYQHFGRILIQLGHYEQAHEIVEATAASSWLQSPYDSVKSLWTFSDLALSRGEREAGLQYARQAQQVCAAHGLHLQTLALQQILNRHRISAL